MQGQRLEVPGNQYLSFLPVSLVEGSERGSEQRHGKSRLILRIEEELSVLFQTRDQFSLGLLPRELDQGRDSGRLQSAQAVSESLAPKCSGKRGFPLQIFLATIRLASKIPRPSGFRLHILEWDNLMPIKLL